MIVISFEENIFLLPKEESYQYEEWTEAEKPKNIVNQFNKLIVEKEKKIWKKLFQKDFGLQSQIDMKREMYKAKNTNRNKDLLNVIKNLKYV